MKRFTVSLLALMALLVAPTFGLQGSAAAVNVFKPCSDPANTSSVCQDVSAQKNSGKNPVIGGLKIVIHLLALIVGLASVIMIVVSGLRMVSSSGDAKGAESARNGILYASIGIVVVVMAELIVAFVLNKL